MLADDLTGACDAGLEVLRAGWRVRCVFADRRRWWELLSRIPGEATVVDLETRRLSEPAARARAAGAGALLRRLGRPPRYYKMDSTLRGHFAAELAALRRALDARRVWVAPANPAQGRWTVGGRQHVRGVPVERTPFATDPLHPARGSDVRVMLEAGFGAGRVALLPLRVLRAGAASVARERREWSRASAVVADAVRDEDLAAVARAVGPGDLAAGAASLARHVLARHGRRARIGVARPAGGTWLAVVGSRNPVSVAQTRAASSARARGLVLTPGRFPSRLSPARAWREAVRLARRAVRVIRARRPGGLVLTGGLTAAAVCAALDIRMLRLRGEIEPGLALASARADYGDVLLVTKPGGFGAPDSLRRLLAGRNPT